MKSKTLETGKKYNSWQDGQVECNFQLQMLLLIRSLCINLVRRCERETFHRFLFQFSYTGL